jgi:hypothetical protein
LVSYAVILGTRVFPMADDNKPTLRVVEECAQTYHFRGPGRWPAAYAPW